jgi:hypothetical protein
MKYIVAYSLIGLAIISSLSACNLPFSGAEVEVTTEPSEAPTSAPVPTSVPASTPTEVSIQHAVIPSLLPAEQSGFVGDQDSSTTADQKRAPGGDRFTFNRFERPFNAETMDTYFPYLDIQEATLYQDETWIYAVIKLKEPGANGTFPGRYALELDLNLDGGGDWFAVVAAPGAEWAVEGVQVWTDTNDDVGGTARLETDNPAFVGNGYETKVFDAGNGDDPDSAWGRISPDDPSSVQIAFKRSLIANDPEYMASVWAGNEDLDPALFDLSDGYTHDRAGTSLVELENFYPIKELSELDSACRMPIGFEPNGSEPGLCPLAAPEKEAACPSQQYYCVNFGNQRVCFCIDQ